MIWGYLVVIAVTLILGIALAPKAPQPKPSAIEDFDLPTAEEGRPIPVVFGEVDITGSNVLWYGDLSVKPIRKRSGFSKNTVGFKYFLGTHEGLCHGPVDALVGILVGDKVVFSGTVTSNSTINVDLPDLFGGTKRGGGIVGDFDVLMGDNAQTANTYLVAQQSPLAVPAYRGILSVVARSGTSGQYIGTGEFPRARAYRVRRILSGWHGGAVFYSAKATVDTNKMNPAHIIYQCLTDPRWGMGLDTSLVDSTTFMAAADALFTENLGLCLSWNQSSSIEDFIQIVMDHVAGALSLNERTGKLELMLIRGDYDAGDLDTYDESSVRDLINYQRTGLGETVNEVTVVYTDPDSRKETSVSQQDLGNIDAQRVKIPQVIQRKGIRNHTVARTILARELQSRSTPLSKITIEVNRKAWFVRYGDLFKFSWEERGIDSVVYRVLKISKGTLTKGTLRIEALEDIYALGVTSTLANPTNPGAPSVPSTPADLADTGINVISSTTLTPPVSPSDGDSYFLPTAGTLTGAWAGHDGDIADWDATSSSWIFTDVPDNTILNVAGTGFVNVVAGDTAAVPWTLPTTTKGDIIAHNGTTNVRLGVGTNGQLLTADSTQTTGLKWETANEVVLDTLGLALQDSSTIDFTFNDGLDQITAIVVDASVTNAKLANMAQSRVKGRAEGAGTGAPTDLTPAELVAIIDAEAATWSGQNSWSLQLLAPNGSAAAPSYALTNNVDSGLFRAAADSVGLSSGGSESFRTTGAGGGIQITGDFTSATSFRSAAGFEMGISSSNALLQAYNRGTFAYISLNLDALNVNLRPSGSLVAQASTGQFKIIDGSAATPSWSYISDTNTGWYRIGADNVGLSTGGTLRFSMNTVLITTALPVSITGNLTLAVAGNGISIKEGSNAAMGVATLVLGTVVVSNTRVTANSRIQLTAQALGTVTAPSALAVSARTAGTSFTILASNLTDTSVVAWEITEPA